MLGPSLSTTVVQKASRQISHPSLTMIGTTNVGLGVGELEGGPSAVEQLQRDRSSPRKD